MRQVTPCGELTNKTSKILNYHPMEFDKSDLEVIAQHGKTPKQVSEELEMIQNGFPYLEIVKPATPGDGIFQLNESMEKKATDLWAEYVAGRHKIMKMVPASGAASRMFKELEALANSDSDHLKGQSLRTFFNDIEKFAFFRRLNLACITLYQRNVSELKNEGRYRDIAKALLRPGGLGYGHLPKALLMFHKIIGTTRTPLEEHMAEGAQYAVNNDGKVHIHFTVSPEHLALMKTKVREVQYLIENRYGVKFDITFSVQKPSTDTIAANTDGSPFRVNGELLFRPGGHGALIENLNDLDADIVFIKNIDNVLPDSKRDLPNHYKNVLGGICAGVKQKIDNYLKILDKGTPEESMLNEMLEFLHVTLCTTNEKAEEMQPDEIAAYLRSKFNRPLRVCGMVRNEGEPGGGPYLVYDPHDETIAPQILELSQIDTTDSHERKLVEQSTHFNPVDLICALKDYKGHKFDLTRYVDPMTGFISHKSKDGKDLTALELPGLWNGAMSNWNTMFIEVPAYTFNPVKEVNDLLRPAHQIIDNISILL